MSKIAILGAGAYGTALGGVLAENGYDIDYYDPLKERERLKDVVNDASAVVLCTPSRVAEKLLPHLPKDKFLIVATKGFLTEKPFRDFKDWAVLAGAGFANDIKAGKETVLTATDERVQQMFKTDYLSVELTADRKGVLICGALKNVYAIFGGIGQVADNPLSLMAYVNDVTKEMQRILKANHAKAKTAFLSCGARDLALTCSHNSRNYEFGAHLINDPRQVPDETVEGVETLNRLQRGEIKLPNNLVPLGFMMRVKDGDFSVLFDRIRI